MYIYINIIKCCQLNMSNIPIIIISLFITVVLSLLN